MNRSKPRDDRFWQRWRWSGAVPAEAVLRSAREAVDRASFAPPDAEEEDTVEVEARTLRNGAMAWRCTSQAPRHATPAAPTALVAAGNNSAAAQVTAATPITVAGTRLSAPRRRPRRTRPIQPARTASPRCRRNDERPACDCARISAYRASASRTCSGLAATRTDK